MRHNKISLLLEDGLQKAEVILAAKDLINNIQKAIERLAEIEIEDTMPLADTMRTVFGEKLSDDFEQLVKSELDSSIEQLRVSKDKISDFITGLEGNFDVSSEGNFSDMAYDDSNDAVEVAPQEEEMDDGFGAVPTAAGEEDEPVGRKLKESADDVKKGDKVKVLKTAMADYLEKNSKSPLNPIEKKYFEELKYNFPDLVTTVVDIKKDGITVVLKKGNKQTTMFIPAMAYKKLEGVNESIDTLVRWILTESAQKMNKEQYFDFKSKILNKKKEDPKKLAEWIKSKKK
jgi:hypothetical protein